MNKEKRLEKSVADLKGSVNVSEKAWRSEFILFESSYFKNLFHSHALLTMVIKNPYFVVPKLNAALRKHSQCKISKTGMKKGLLRT